MLVFDQVKAITEYVCFLKHLDGMSDGKVFSLNQTSLNFTGRPASGLSLSHVGLWLCPMTSLGFKDGKQPPCLSHGALAWAPVQPQPPPWAPSPRGCVDASVCWGPLIQWRVPWVYSLWVFTLYLLFRFCLSSVRQKYPHWTELMNSRIYKLLCVS